MKKLPFNEVVTDITSKFKKIKKSEYQQSGHFLIIDQGKDHIAGYTDDARLVDPKLSPIIVFGDHTRTFKYESSPIALGADGAKALKVNPQIAYDKYVFFFLKSIKLKDAGYSRHFKFLKEVKIPIPYKGKKPSLDGQVRIATLLSRVEALIATRKASLSLLDEFLKSTFLEMFGDPVRNEKGWEKKKIRDIAKVKIGPFGSLLHAEDYVENGIPLINPSHIVDGEVSPNNKLSLTKKKYKELSAYHLKKNDVVVARRGEIGRCAIVKNDDSLFCGTGSMFVRIETDYTPILLQFQIYRTSLKNFLENNAKGVTMKNLNSKVLGDLEILNPPSNLQNHFVTIVEKTESLKTLYQQGLAELENLYGTLSQKAFKGELDLSRVPLDNKPQNTRKSDSECSVVSVVNADINNSAVVGGNVMTKKACR